MIDSVDGGEKVVGSLYLWTWIRPLRDVNPTKLIYLGIQGKECNYWLHVYTQNRQHTYVEITKINKKKQMLQIAGPHRNKHYLGSPEIHWDLFCFSTILKGFHKQKSYVYLCWWCHFSALTKDEIEMTAFSIFPT